MVTPYKELESGKKEQVRSMFNNIAYRYDFLNHLLSCGIDILWRKKAIGQLKADKPLQILDIATGTADFAFEALALNPEKVTGVDISEGMLAIGKQKVKNKGLENKIMLMQADSENLPFENASFDAVTVGFGVRNFEDLEKGLSEMYRVLKPSGKAVILEFSKPRSAPFKQMYSCYFNYLLPRIGRFFSKDRSAYSYLPDSVNAFPDGPDFLNILKRSGFREVSWKRLLFGIASIYTGKK